jgi:nucleosome binding factor SPN SPT16 subunit
MNPVFASRLLHYSIFLLILLLLSCRSKETPAPAPETDTKILVKAAFDSVDLNKVKINRNMKRAAMIKAEMDREQDPAKRVSLAQTYATELLKGGATDEAIKIYEALATYIKDNHFKLDSQSLRNMYSLMGIAYMRKGEIEKCVKNHNHH